MKIVCDGCQAKYSIADDKVRAKVFKIRCKKCSNVIVVRGVDAAEVSAPAPVVDDDAIWHLVIDQEQIGPLTAEDVHQRFAAGAIDGDTFTWREGMDEWLPLAQLDAFAELATSGATTPVPLAAAPAPRAREPERDHGDDLFGSQLAAAPAETSAQKLRGERNESSVLFSLGNLAQIANHRPPVAAAPMGGSATSGGGEGSGLIDIRSMASAYLGTPGATTQSRVAGAGIGSIDDLPVFGGGGFSEPAVLVPAARPATNTKLLYVMIGAVALLASVAIVMMVILLGNKKSEPQVAAATPAPAEPTHAIAPRDEPTPSAPAEVKAQAPKEAPPPAAPPPAPKAPPARATPPAHVATPPVHHTAQPPTEAPPQLKATKDTKETCDDVSCIVNADSPCCITRARNNAGASHEAPRKTVTVDPNLPEKLVSSQVTSTMATVRAKIMACGDRTPAKGIVKLHLKVNGDGRVTDVAIEASPDPALGACAAAAAKRAVFPKTQTGGSFGIPYPF